MQEEKIVILIIIAILVAAAAWFFPYYYKKWGKVSYGGIFLFLGGIALVVQTATQIAVLGIVAMALFVVSLILFIFEGQSNNKSE